LGDDSGTEFIIFRSKYPDADFYVPSQMPIF